PLFPYTTLFRSVPPALPLRERFRPTRSPLSRRSSQWSPIPCDIPQGTCAARSPAAFSAGTAEGRQVPDKARAWQSFNCHEDASCVPRPFLGVPADSTSTGTTLAAEIAALNALSGSTALLYPLHTPGRKIS